MAKQRKYRLTDEAVKMAEDTAQFLFQSAYADLSRPRKISVADHVWQNGFPYYSRALKDELGVSHG